MAEEIEDDIFSQFQGETIKRRIQTPDGVEVIEYKKGEALGEGGFAISYKAINIKTKEIFVLKEMLVNKKNQNIYNQEQEIHSSLNHPNIVKLIDTFNFNEKLYFLLEYCENRDLFSLLIRRKKLKEVEVIYYITNLIKAIEYLHKQRIVHRDIKLSNIFLTDKLEVKLGDFGLAKKISEKELMTGEDGTIYYMAPEIFKGKGYSFEVDIWAIGIIMYKLILGELPFYGNNKKNTEYKIMKGELKFPENSITSKAAKDLIKKILVKNPNERPTLNQILQHDFFHLGRSIPKLLPIVFKDKEPSIKYIKNFMTDADDNGIVNRDVKFILKSKIQKKEKIVLEQQNNNKINDDVYVAECFKEKKYIDDYGLAYVLSNKYFGVCFKDNTKILCNPKRNKYFYIKKGTEKKIYNRNDENIKKNHDLNKKVDLLEQFLLHCIKKNESNTSQSETNNNCDVIEVDDKPAEVTVYVDSYYIDDDSTILLILNNKIIQIMMKNGDNVFFLKGEEEIIKIHNKNRTVIKNHVFNLQEFLETQDGDIRKKIETAQRLFAKVLENK